MKLRVGLWAGKLVVLPPRRHVARYADLYCCAAFNADTRTLTLTLGHGPFGCVLSDVYAGGRLERAFVFKRAGPLAMRSEGRFLIHEAAFIGAGRAHGVRVLAWAMPAVLPAAPKIPVDLLQALRDSVRLEESKR